MLEKNTVSKIESILDELGYTTHHIGGGIVGVLENGSGASVLFRADIDALAVAAHLGHGYKGRAGSCANGAR